MVTICSIFQLIWNSKYVNIPQIPTFRAILCLASFALVWLMPAPVQLQELEVSRMVLRGSKLTILFRQMLDASVNDTSAARKSYPSTWD